MSTLRAVVDNGRVSVEVEYPDGTEVDVTVAETEAGAGKDPFAEMDPDERARLHAVLDQSRADAEAGLGIPAEQVIAELKGL